MSTVHVHTLGDSTLDNIYWVNNPEKKSVEGQLRTKLGKEYTVTSNAYDGFTTNSLLKGDTVGKVLPSGKAKTAYQQVKGKTKIKPLDILWNDVKKAPDAKHYVVLSVGGNDFRESLHNPARILKEISNIQKRYIQIVEKLKALPGSDIRPILVMQYPTDANNDQYRIYPTMKLMATLQGKGEKKDGIELLADFMKEFYAPILKAAKEKKIPVLDLSRTFDPKARLYICGIEPNKAGGALIAEGLKHIIKQHDFAGESKVYAKLKPNKTYSVEENK